MMVNVTEYAKSLDYLILNKNNDSTMNDMQDALACCQMIINELKRQNDSLLKTIDDSIATCEEILSS